MDIKNSKEKYLLTIGLEFFDLDKIERSVEILLSSEIPYEFRTTVVKELHTPEDFISIGKWLYGAKNYYLQAFKDSGNLIKGGLHPYSKEEMLHIKNLVASYIPDTSLRGID